MIDPDYDPYEDLENCKIAIHELGHAIEQLVKATNLQAEVVRKQEKQLNENNRRLRRLQQLYEAK